MKLDKLKPAKGSVFKRKRIARGQGSGMARTATRGHKGSQSRAGYSRRYSYEGGQMPIQRRVPKFGFKNINRKTYSIFNLDRLEDIAGLYKVSEINPELLRKLKIISKNDEVKILGRGKLESKLTIKAHAFSEAAKKAIEDNGGAIEIL